jgi:hypothetical protein
MIGGGMTQSLFQLEHKRATRNATDNIIKRAREQVKADTINKNYFKGLQNQLINNQLKAAQDFDVNKYVQGETSALRQNLAQQLSGAQKNLRANESARGMLFSGRRQAGEAGLTREASGKMQQGATEIAQNALQKQQALYAQPLLSKINLGMALQRQAASLNDIKAAESAARQQLIGSGMAAIGSGIGTGAANVSEGKKFWG